MKTIVLAEKPGVGRELARVLGCYKKTKSFIEGEEYIVTWAMGHLVELSDPEVYDERWGRWSLDTLPMLPERMKLKVIGRTRNQFNTVRKLLGRNDAGSLVVATDAGREGELVARWIMRLGGWKKPFKRLWINSQTDSAIREGFRNLREGREYDNLLYAAESRAEADWLVGLNVTRALSCKHEVKLSAGRVQTPTLALVVKREEEISIFRPEAYWTVTADFGEYTGTWTGPDGATRIQDQNRARETADKVEGSRGTIVEVQVKDGRSDSPLAYDLTSLQTDANRILEFSAKKTLQTLQALYERHKIVTYPRTDSRYITKDMVPTIPARLDALEQTGLGQYVKKLKKILASSGKQGAGGPVPGKRFVNDSKVTDHHAVIPTEEPVVPDRLSGDERKLWELVARRFLQVLSPPCRYREIRIITEAEGERFISRGKETLDPGWKALARRGETPGTEEDAVQPLRKHTKGETRDVQHVSVRQGWTKPPPRYTEGTLLSAMENAGKFIEDRTLKASIAQGGLGTPATRADIIEKIISNYYVERRSRELVPTSRGCELIDIVPDTLTRPELTARWELRLSRIASGEEQYSHFLKDIRFETGKLVEEVKRSSKTYAPRGTTGRKCPLCGGPLYPVRGKRGKTLQVCQGLSCGFEEEEGGGDFRGSRPSGKEKRIARKLMNQYGKGGEETSTFGDLLKASMERKKEREGNS